MVFEFRPESGTRIARTATWKNNEDVGQSPTRSENNDHDGPTMENIEAFFDSPEPVACAPTMTQRRPMHAPAPHLRQQ